MKTFPLNSKAKTTALKQPKELYTYARDIDGEWVHDRAEVKKALLYYYFPDLSLDKPVDLSGGYDKFKKIPEEQNLADFESLLASVMRYEKDHGKIGVDIITFRGLLTKLLVLPYNMTDPIDFNIVVFDGQLFMAADRKLELARREQQKATQTGDPDYISKCEYSGYKFETLATLPKPWCDCLRLLIEKRSKKIVNNYEQYISVVRSGIGSVKMLIAGEVDCVWDYIPEQGTKNVLLHYAELKTLRTISNPGQVFSFEKKLFKTWAQCFLLGIGKIVYGFRDQKLMLKSVEVYNTEEVPLLIKGNPLAAQDTKKSSPNCMLALKWYGAVMEWINTEIPKDDESRSWRLSFDPGSHTFSLSEVVGEEHERWRNGEILTSEFKDWRKESSTNNQT